MNAIEKKKKIIELVEKYGRLNYEAGSNEREYDFDAITNGDFCESILLNINLLLTIEPETKSR